MKTLTLTAALAAMLAAAPVFAADASPATDTNVQTAAVTSDSSMSSMHAAEPAAKTRAEVYQELIEAEKSGELARLNSLLYSN